VIFVTVSKHSLLNDLGRKPGGDVHRVFFITLSKSINSKMKVTREDINLFLEQNHPEFNGDFKEGVIKGIIIASSIFYTREEYEKKIIDNFKKKRTITWEILSLIKDCKN